MSDTHKKKKPTVSIITMGCPKNQVDSEKLAYLLKKASLSVKHEGKKADVFIVNTCGFIQLAREESIETILEIRQNNPGAFIAAVGCMTQLYRDEILHELPEIDAIYGVNEYDELVKDLTGKKIFEFDQIDERVLSTPTHYAYLKISEGCNRSCSFCTIPVIRGRLKSYPMENLIQEAKKLAKKGVKELIVVSQDTVSYGYDLHGRSMLLDLLRALSDIDGFEWIRIMYLYPSGITNELIKEIATNDKIVKYFDIPFQHSEDRVLAAMQRSSTRKQLDELFVKIRDSIPEAVIRGTVMVGFPEEGVKEFNQLLQFIEKHQLERVAVFPFSLEEKSPIYLQKKHVSMPSMQTIKQRYNVLTSFLDEFLIKSNIRFLDKCVEAIVEYYNTEENALIGRTCYDAPEIDFDLVIESENETHTKTVFTGKVKIKGIEFYRLNGTFQKC